MKEITKEIIDSYFNCLNFENDVISNPRTNVFFSEIALNSMRLYVNLQIRNFHEIYGKDNLLYLAIEEFGEKAVERAINSIKLYILEVKDNKSIPRFQYIHYFSFV